MNKREFLEALRSNLSGEVPVSEINTNIKYYDSYISEHATTEAEEERCIQEIGEPRLIARTIITSYEMSHEQSNKSRQEDTIYEDTTDSDNMSYSSEEDIKSHILKVIPLKYKVIGIISTVAILFILFYVAKAFLFLFVRLFLPIASIVVLFMLINRLFNK